MQVNHAPSATAAARRAPAITYGLWAIQALLALLFVFAGAMKLMMSADQLRGSVALPVWFMRFIGVCELLGGLGLILPPLTRVAPGLTPLAAAGLIIIMAGAVAVTLISNGVAQALFPLVTGLLLVLVARERWRR